MASTGDETNTDGAGLYAGLASGDRTAISTGATYEGGSGGGGTLFKVTTNGALTHNLYVQRRRRLQWQRRRFA